MISRTTHDFHFQAAKCPPSAAQRWHSEAPNMDDELNIGHKSPNHASSFLQVLAGHCVGSVLEGFSDQLMGTKKEGATKHFGSIILLDETHFCWDFWKKFTHYRGQFWFYEILYIYCVPLRAKFCSLPLNATGLKSWAPESGAWCVFWVHHFINSVILCKWFSFFLSYFIFKMEITMPTS